MEGWGDYYVPGSPDELDSDTTSSSVDSSDSNGDYIPSEMENLFYKLNDYIREGDKDGMMSHINQHKLRHSDYKHKFNCDYPIVVAACSGNVDIFNLLIDLGYKMASGEDHPLIKASEKGHLELVKTLVEDHDLEPEQGAMLIAAIRKKMDVVKYLINAGASVDMRITGMIYNGSIPLIFAVGFKNMELCRLFLDEGADVNKTGIKGNTALHEAASHLEEEIVEMLLDAGARVNAKNIHGDTPFILAANLKSGLKSELNNHHCPELKTARILHSKGADLEARNSSGRTALRFAVSSPILLHFLLTEVNLSPKPYKNDLFKIAFHKGEKDSIRLLVALGYCPDNIDDLAQGVKWEDSEGQDFLRNLRQICATPQRLEDLCSLRIRKQFGRNISNVIDKLSLSEGQKDLLLFNHIQKPSAK